MVCCFVQIRIDSQYTGGMKLYKKKIFPFRIDDHCSIAFAFAGHEGNAKMVIQDSREAIAEMSPAQRTLKAVRQQLRSFVKSVNHDYVCPDHGGFDQIGRASCRERV